MLAAGATLLAVIAGGLLSYAAQSRLDERRATREREREDARADAERERERARAEAERERERERLKAERDVDRARVKAGRDRERERMEAERARDQEVADAELRVAKRLLLEELDLVALHYDMLVKRGVYPRWVGPATEPFLPTVAWDANKRTFALGFSSDEWDSVALIMHTVARVRAIVAEAEPLTPVEPVLLEEVGNGLRLVAELYEQLGGEPPPSVTE